jgi:hypothetical protein
MIGGVHCHLNIGNSTIGSKHRKLLRNIRRHNNLKEYIKTKAQWDDDTFNKIDWSSHEHSVRNFKDGPHKFLIKFLHNLLPVGKRVSRYDPIKYPSKCPSCDTEVEDFRHLLSCQNSERAKWQSTLRTKLRERCEFLQTDPTLTDLMLHGINSWLKDIPIPLNLIPTCLTPLIESQTRIGWDQFILGRWSSKWQQFQQQYISTQTFKPTNKYALPQHNARFEHCMNSRTRASTTAARHTSRPAPKPISPKSPKFTISRTGSQRSNP